MKATAKMASYKTGGMTNPNAKAVVKPSAAPKKKMATKKLSKKK